VGAGWRTVRKCETRGAGAGFHGRRRGGDRPRRRSIDTPGKGGPRIPRLGKQTACPSLVCGDKSAAFRPSGNRDSFALTLVSRLP